jgi:hypothetical protein
MTQATINLFKLHQVCLLPFEPDAVFVSEVWSVELSTQGRGLSLGAESIFPISWRGGPTVGVFVIFFLSSD